MPDQPAAATSEPESSPQRERLLDLLDPERARQRAQAKGFEVQSSTTAEGRQVAVVLSADFARLLHFALTKPGHVIRLDEIDRLAAFAADLAKVNP